MSAVFNLACRNNLGFVPMTEAEAEHIASEMKLLVYPMMTLIAEIGHRPVGFVICVPDINSALGKINGRLLPFGLLRLLYYRKKIRTARFVALGVVEKYRRAGIAAMLGLLVLAEGGSRGFTG